MKSCPVLRLVHDFALNHSVMGFHQAKTICKINQSGEIILRQSLAAEVHPQSARFKSSDSVPVTKKRKERLSKFSWAIHSFSLNSFINMNHITAIVPGWHMVFT